MASPGDRQVVRVGNPAQPTVRSALISAPTWLRRWVRCRPPSWQHFGRDRATVCPRAADGRRQASPRRSSSTRVAKSRLVERRVIPVSEGRDR
jgi:hypothetical protein